MDQAPEIVMMAPSTECCLVLPNNTSKRIAIMPIGNKEVQIFTSAGKLLATIPPGEKGSFLKEVKSPWWRFWSTEPRWVRD